MVIFTKKFGTLDPHLPIVWDKVPKKNGFFDTFPKSIYQHIFFFFHVMFVFSCFKTCKLVKELKCIGCGCCIQHCKVDFKVIAWNVIFGMESFIFQAIENQITSFFSKTTFQNTLKAISVSLLRCKNSNEYLSEAKI